jgi:hypothetical protein
MQGLMCGVFFKFDLTPADSLCCVCFIYPALCWFWYLEIGTINWAQSEDGDRFLNLEQGGG